MGGRASRNREMGGTEEYTVRGGCAPVLLMGLLLVGGATGAYADMEYNNTQAINWMIDKSLDGLDAGIEFVEHISDDTAADTDIPPDVRSDG